VNCSSFRELMMKHFDGDFNDIENARMKQHLKHCKECMYEFEDLKSIFSVIEMSGDVTPPEDFEQAVMSRIYSLESARMKRMSVVLVIIYNLAVLVAIGILMLFASGLESLAALEASMNETAEELYISAGELFQTFSGIISLFYQTFMQLIDMYYHYIIFAIAALLTIQRAFTLRFRQNRRGA